VTENPSNQAESSIEKSSHKVLEKKKKLTSIERSSSPAILPIVMLV